MKTLQAAMAIYQNALGTGSQEGSSPYSALNLATLGGGGGMGIDYGLINAIRRNRAAQALKIQQAFKGGSQMGGQLAQLGGKLWGQQPVDTLGTLGDEPLIGSMGV
jgi:hypothetical protein